MTSSIEVVVSPRADRDVRQILAYTEKQWGTGQRDAYQATPFPRTDGSVSSLRLGDLSRTALRLCAAVLRHHTIVYRRDSARVTILRIRSHRARR